VGACCAAAEAAGLTVEIVTQFCFNVRAILDFIARLRALGFDHRVRVGLVGPTNLTSLMRYASRCGVRASAQGLARRAGLMRQVFAMATPDDLVRTLADMAPAGVVPHFFSFGGVPATGRWARAVADGRISLEGDEGFRVEPPRGDDPLLDPAIPNLIVTPHVAWAAREARQRCLNEMAANIKDFVGGGRRSRVD